MNEGQTHWVTCYLEPDHYECALARIDELATELACAQADRSTLDCRFAGQYWEASGSHCALDNPCMRCQLEKEVAHWRDARWAAIDAGDAMQEELKTLRHDLDKSMANHSADLAELAEVKADAERYRWLRDRMDVRHETSAAGDSRPAIGMRIGFSFLDCCSDPSKGWTDIRFFNQAREKLDAAIDKARGKS